MQSSTQMRRTITRLCTTQTRALFEFSQNIWTSMVSPIVHVRLSALFFSTGSSCHNSRLTRIRSETNDVESWWCWAIVHGYKVYAGKIHNEYNIYIIVSYWTRLKSCEEVGCQENNVTYKDSDETSLCMRRSNTIKAVVDSGFYGGEERRRIDKSFEKYKWRNDVISSEDTIGSWMRLSAYNGRKSIRKLPAAFKRCTL